jgi:glycosyltransferase involved in cell wall biosynthesis
VVIHPPVDTERFVVSKRDDGYFLLVSALVPYKRVDLAVEAFNRVGERLLIVGSGPEMTKLQSLARPNVQFLGWQDDDTLTKLYSACRAVIFPGVEDFGIVPVEAMASGKPVVAYAKGGALETVREGGRLPTGVFFHEQTPDALVEALQRLKTRQWNSAAIRRHAQTYNRERFKRAIREFVAARVDEHLPV